MIAARYLTGNRLLDALSAADLATIEHDITVVPVRAHETTHSVGQALRWVDFPIDAVLSVVVTLKNGDTVEVGTVGNEGFVESDAALESAFSSRTSFCQVRGNVGRMSVERFGERMESSVTFARSMRHNVRAMLYTAQQFTVCNVKHNVLQRCARWFAMTADRVGRSEFTLTHDFLAIMLGAQRSVVTEAVDALEDLGAIVYRRGAVAIVDTGVLMDAVCECYEASKEAFAVSLLRADE